MIAGHHAPARHATRAFAVRVVRAVLLAALGTAACAQDPATQAARYLQSGDRFARAGRDAAAVIEYRNAVRLTPTSDAAYRRLGAALARLGRTDESRAALARADSFADGEPLPQDEEALRAVVLSHPRHLGARLALATRLMERGVRDDARAELDAALAIDPTRELTHRGLASLDLDERRLPSAESHLRAAAEATPQQYRSRLALADFYFAQRRWADAAAALDRAATDPALGDAIAVRRVALANETGAPADARRDLDRLVETAPSAEAWALQAQFAYSDGDPSRAEEAARRALDLDPGLVFAQNLVDTIRWERLQGAPASSPRPRASNVPAARH